MEDNSRNQSGRDRYSDRKQDRNQTKRDNTQNTSTRQLGAAEKEERGSDRKDRLTTGVPDNYERDSE